MKGFTRTMTLNRNLTRTLLAAAVALGTLCSSSAAFAATGGHAASTPASRLLTRPSGPSYEGGKAHGYKIVANTPEYTGGKADRFLTRPSGPGYDGGKAHGHQIVADPPEYEGG
jgi:hypothetical protein